MVKSRIYSLYGMGILNKFKSPALEQSCYTRIPIEFIESVRKVLQTHLPEQYAYRIRFQGPRYGRHKISTNKVDATHFMVYVHDRKRPIDVAGYATSAVAKPPEFIWNNGYKYQLCVL